MEISNFDKQHRNQYHDLHLKPVTVSGRNLELVQ
jgi:hypothetical protein